MKNLFKKVLTTIVFVTAAITSNAQKSYRITAAAYTTAAYSTQHTLAFNQPVYFTITQTDFQFTLANGHILKFGESGNCGFTGKLTPTETASNTDGREFKARDSAGKDVTMVTKYNYSTGTWLINVTVTDYRTLIYVFNAK